MNELQKKRVKFFFFCYFILLVVLTFFRFPDIKNELKYFVVTQNMIETKNYFILKYFNELYPDKPPIYFWILSTIKSFIPRYFYPISLITTGIFPLFATGYIWFKIVKKYWNEFMGYIFVSIFLAFPFVLGVSMVLRMDTLMNFFISLAIYNFLKYYENTRLKYIFLFYLSITIGILIKGGASFVIPILTVFTLLILEDNFKFIKKVHILFGITIILIGILTWFGMILQYSEGKEYLKLLLGQETLGRVVKSKAHIRPFYFYISKLPLTFFPLTPFFVIGIFKLTKDLKKLDFLTLFSLALFFPNLLFFSLVSGKLDIYLLPLYPAAILISLKFIDTFCKKRKKLFFYSIISLNFLVVITVTLGINYYTNNYTLKNLVAILKNESKAVYSYRFDDAKNITLEIKRDVNNVELSNIESLPTQVFIITRNEYATELSNKTELIYKNKQYSLFLMYK